MHWRVVSVAGMYGHVVSVAGMYGRVVMKEISLYPVSWAKDLDERLVTAALSGIRGDKSCDLDPDHSSMGALPNIIRGKLSSRWVLKHNNWQCVFNPISSSLKTSKSKFKILRSSPKTPKMPIRRDGV